MPLPPSLAFRRFGLGPRPGDLQRVSADPRGALLAELEKADSAPGIDGLPSSQEIFLEIGRTKPDPSVKNVDPNTLSYVIAYGKEIAARIEKARAVDIGFFERLTTFWANHFAVAARANGYTQGMVGAYEREAIRPNVLGRFHDMLYAATRHPAMLLYLNNAASTGPDSKVGRAHDSGLNENHARELLELHTVGVDAGYTQADVTSLAQVLTGWTVDRDRSHTATVGQFIFAPGRHEPGPQTVMGVLYPQEGEEQGKAVLADLAKRPQTAHHVATKLARHFVADVPPPSLVESLASTFQRTDGDLWAVTEALVGSEEAWQPPTKIRTPQEFVWSALRALSLDLDAPFVKKVFVDLGQPIMNPPSPQGFSDGGDWLAPDAMTNRLDVATELALRAPLEGNPSDLALAVLGEDASHDTMMTIGAAESQVQALSLMLMSPEFQRR